MAKTTMTATAARASRTTARLILLVMVGGMTQCSAESASRVTGKNYTTCCKALARLETEGFVQRLKNPNEEGARVFRVKETAKVMERKDGSLRWSKSGK